MDVFPDVESENTLRSESIGFASDSGLKEMVCFVMQPFDPIAKCRDSFDHAEGSLKIDGIYKICSFVRFFDIQEFKVICFIMAMFTMLEFRRIEFVSIENL